MKSVNVQHNDIKIGELLIDENKKVYLCDFGMGSINNKLGCGINLWDCNNIEKPGGYYDDANALKRLKLIYTLETLKWDRIYNLIVYNNV